MSHQMGGENVIYFWRVITKRVIVSRIDWGLVHAARCISIIREIIRKDSAISIAAASRASFLLYEEFSGDLPHKYPLPANANYIGWLSRFNSEDKSEAPAKKYDLLVLLSGTEPLRTELEKNLAEQIQRSNQNALMVRGATEEQKEFSRQNNLTTVPYLGSKELFEMMRVSDTIICRPGY